MEEYSLREYQIAELEELLESYPWFSIARKELFLKMSAMGEEYRRDALHRTALYIYPDYSVFRQGYVLSSAASSAGAEPEQVYELDFSAPAAADGQGGRFMEEEVEEKKDTAHDSDSGNKPVYVLVGGDYFMPEDLKRVQNQDISSLSSGGGTAASVDSSEFTDEAYYTETLARIYADQELYDRANEVYEKLILLYPEKSAYFAALKNDIKKHLL